MSDSLPFSQASDNNKLPILEVLSRHLPGQQTLLEIGGGTGQHAAFFAGHFPDLHWQTTDVPDNVESLNLRVRDAALPNLPAAVPLDVNDATWDVGACDTVFSANSLHIMSAPSVENFFAGVGRHLGRPGKLLVYGPFKYGGEFTTPSNANFDLWLKSRDSRSGIRDFEWVNELAAGVGLTLLEDNAMPANNQLLVWQHAG